MVLTIYAIRASSLAAHYALADLFDGMGGSLESGELALQESSLAHEDLKSAQNGAPKRFVSQANFARWQSEVAMKQVSI
jgi:23S rRNA (cytosine1962-C5)-methyltransferase